MERNRILCGDSLALMREMPENSVDLIFADPPYWLRTAGALVRVEGTAYDGCDETWDNVFSSESDYAAFTRAWLQECRRILKKDGSIWVIGGMQCVYTVGAIMQDMGFWFINDVIWHKKNPTPNFLGARLNNSHETLLWAAKNKNARFTFHYKTAKELNTDTVGAAEYAKGVRKQMGSVWRIGVCQGAERLRDENGAKLHATQKPEALLRRVIAISSNPGDLVFDPFGGTFTTAAVAKRMGRDYLSFDNDPVYVAAGQRRLNAVVPQMGFIEDAVYDIKPPRVPFSALLKSGYLRAGETLFLKDGSPAATLTEDGKALFHGETMSLHAAAARAKNVRAARLNGFDHWFVERGGAFLSLKAVRNDYIRRELKSTRVYL